MAPGIVRLTPDSTRSPRWIGYTGVRASKSMSNVEFQGVSKSYPIYDSPGDRLKELITPRRYQFHRDFWALRDVSFDIRRIVDGITFGNALEFDVGHAFASAYTRVADPARRTG